MQDIAKILIFVGVVCVLAGIVLLAFGKLPWLGRLPGDILIKRPNMTLYFPIMTCVVVSIMVSFLLYLWNNR